MFANQTTPEFLAAILIAGGSLGAAVLLLLRGWSWRIALLAVMSLACGALLYLALFPPRLPVGGETLVVATAEAPATLEVAPGERLVALPGAPAIDGAERMADLATALRRHRQVQRVRIEGRGLAPRDRDLAAGVPVEFTPMALPDGVTRLEPPADVPAGSVFTLAGEVTGMAGVSVELLDPAGRIVDRREIDGEPGFLLGGSSRSPGLASFTLRLRGANSEIVSDTPLPVRALAEDPVRALLVGAPSPETKYLRRWGEDSQVDLASTLNAGLGVDLGDRRAGLGSAQLREADVLIIDDRTLLRIGSGSRASLARAVDAGLGVVVRMSGPATGPLRASWRSLGLAVEGGGEALPVALPPAAPDAEALAALRGPGSRDVPRDLNTLDDALPDIDRWAVRTPGTFVAEVTDADGAMLSGWQQRGQGRVALWTVANSYALVLNGRSDLYYQWWSDTVSAVTRAVSTFRPEVTALARAGERVTICGIVGSPTVSDPDGNFHALAIDPAAGPKGCAAYWPAIPGMHTIQQPREDDTLSFDFAVLPSDALAEARARTIGEETALWAARQDTAEERGGVERDGPAWPWLLAWLTLGGALWFLERRWRDHLRPA